MTKKLSTLSLLLFSVTALFAQLTMPPDGGNKKATVVERIGITDVTINYNRPAVKGREGKIWAGLVHNGFKDLGFGTSKAAPWRAGANENTTITFSTDAKVEGKDIKAGTYGFFIAMGTGDATLIFSNNISSWGSFFYDPKEDELRVTVKTIPLTESVERLKYEFSDETGNTATISLLWEKLRVPFKVEVDYVKTQMQSFTTELRGEKGFNPEAWQTAAQFAADHNVELEKALQWSDYSLTGVYVGKKDFKNFVTKADILNKLGRVSAADSAMKTAMTFATMEDLHQYGRQLLRQKKNKEALEVFKANAQKNGFSYMTYMGLARGYSANGDYPAALKAAQSGLKMAHNPAEKDSADQMITTLKDGRDIN